MYRRTYLFRIHKPDLARRHAGVFAQVRPGGVDDGHVVLFVAYLRKPKSVFLHVFPLILEVHKQTDLQSNSPLSTARSPPAIPSAARPIATAAVVPLLLLLLHLLLLRHGADDDEDARQSGPSRASGAGICARRRGCRRGTVFVTAPQISLSAFSPHPRSRRRDSERTYPINEYGTSAQENISTNEGVYICMYACERGEPSKSISPNIAVPAELDQLFVYYTNKSSDQRFFLCLTDGRTEEEDCDRRRKKEKRERIKRTLEFVFAHVNGGRGVDDVGGEEVDHCLFVCLFFRGLCWLVG